MDQQLAEWVDFCQGRRNFDDSHFYTLFFEGEGENGRRSEEELKIIFQELPKGQALFQIAFKELTSQISDDFPSDIESYLIENTRNDLIQKKPIIEQEGEQKIIELLAGKIMVIDDMERVEESRAASWVDAQIDAIVGDYCTYHLEFDSPSIFALKEAYYGFFTDLNMVRYLLSPLVKPPINFEFYYNLWKVGGDYSVTEDGIIVSRYLPD